MFHRINFVANFIHDNEYESQVLSENLPDTFIKRDSQYVSHNIYNARKKLNPFNKPKNIDEVHKILENMTIKTCHNEPFVLVNDCDKHIVIFSCATNLQILATMEAIFLDCTFLYCTKYFKQLFTVHGIQNGNYVQLCFALLPSKKSTAAYVAFLELLLNLCPLLTPSTIVVDYEISIHNAVRQLWPGVEVVGCRFYLREAWYRQVQGLGL